jgi:hypothetical protein
VPPSRVGRVRAAEQQRRRKSSEGPPIHIEDGQDRVILEGEEPRPHATASGCGGRGSARRRAGRPRDADRGRAGHAGPGRGGLGRRCLGAVRQTPALAAGRPRGAGLSGERDSLWLIGTLRKRYPLATILASAAGADPRRSRVGCSWGPRLRGQGRRSRKFLQAIRRAAAARSFWPAPRRTGWASSPTASTGGSTSSPG